MFNFISKPSALVFGVEADSSPPRPATALGADTSSVKMMGDVWKAQNRRENDVYDGREGIEQLNAALGASPRLSTPLGRVHDQVNEVIADEFQKKLCAMFSSYCLIDTCEIERVSEERDEEIEHNIHKCEKLLSTADSMCAGIPNLHFT